MSSYRRTDAEPMPPEDVAAIIGLFALLAFSPPALIAAGPLTLVKRHYLREFVIATLLATVVAALLARPALAHWHDAFRAIHHIGLFVHPHRALVAALPKAGAAWLMMSSTAPLMALCIDIVRPRSIAEQANAEERRQQRARRWRQRRARRRAGTLTARTDAGGAVAGRALQVVVLGTKIEGERVDWEDRSKVVGVRADALLRHVLVIGPSGSGKTETLLRLAYGAAAAGFRVYYIDAKADAHVMERFRSLAALAAHVDTRVFPTHGFDGFRGDRRAIFNRLIELIRYSEDGDGAYYRDVAKHLLWLACSTAEGPPRSSAELLRRLSAGELRRAGAAAGSDPLDGLGQRELAGLRVRYEAFFAAIEGVLDGGFSFEDARAAYLMLDGLALKEETGSLARFLLEDFSHFAKYRKPQNERALLILDEFSAIADSANVVDLVERLRSHNVGVVLAPQAEAGMGDELARQRIVQNVETVFLHASKRPEELVALAGTRLEVQSSFQHEDGRGTGMGSGRTQHVFKVDPNEVRQLAPGECFVIREGRQVRVQIAQAPPVPALPPLEPEPLAGLVARPRRPARSVQPPEDLRL